MTKNHVISAMVKYKFGTLDMALEPRPILTSHELVQLFQTRKKKKKTFSDPTKYFGCELGAQTQFDLKNDRYIVNGSHDAAKLQDLLFSFIDK